MKTTNNRKEIELNFFHGFYESIHDSAFDSYIEYGTEYLIEECNATEEDIQKLSDLYWNSNFSGARKEYCECFVNEFSHYILDVSKPITKDAFEFVDLDSPKYYNFTTDRIFCTVSNKFIKHMVKNTDKETLETIIKERFTSRDGFSSFYSNNLDDWPKNALEWDHNQLGALLDAYLITNHTDDLDALNWELSSDIPVHEFMCDYLTTEYKELSNKLYNQGDRVNIEV